MVTPIISPSAELATVAELIMEIHKRAQNSSVSLPQYTKGTNIMSRMYIEESLANEDIMIPLIGMLNQIYAGFILTSLQLNQYVAGSRTVRDILRVVSTEQYVDVIDIATEQFGELDLDSLVVSSEATTFELDAKSQRLMSGRVIEVDLKVNDNDKGSNIKVTLYVQLIPYLITKDVSAGFINLNFNPSIGRRFAQYRIGTIGIRDFLFACDLVNDYKKAIKQDKTGVLSDMLDKQSNSLSKAIKSFVGINPEQHNLASSILIMEKNNFDKVCVKQGVNFNIVSNRHKFFTQSFTMFLVIVDIMYNDVSIYFHSLDHKATYTFNMINKMATGKDDGFNLKDIVSAFAQGGSPKF